ncbi:hypothetical protein HUW46_03213 [Amycolatopsis sp. CA-230715]|nr:hypothetical protein HUW46_03213 [Amycolatopsis sp. CA-230715]
MDFWGAVRLLRKRWYVVLPAIVVALALTALTYVSIPTRYSSTGVVVLTAPSAGGKVAERSSPDQAVQINPLLAFDGSLVTSAQIAAQVLNDPATKEALGIATGSSDTYTASNGTTNGPFVFVTAQSDSDARSRQLVGGALDRARQELDTRQRELKAPEGTFIQVQVLVKPTVPEAQIGGKLRFAGAAFVLTVILALAVTFAYDSIANAVRRRRPKSPGAAAPRDPELTRPAMRPVNNRQPAEVSAEARE